MSETSKPTNCKRRSTDIDEYVLQPLKFRRICKGVRKELFKNGGSSQKKRREPVEKLNSDLSPDSLNQFLLNTLPAKHAFSKQANITIQNENVKKSLVFKCESTTKNTARQNVSNFKLPTTPQTKSIGVLHNFKSPGITDFLKLEQLCETSAENQESPVSSMCSLLENNMLLDNCRKNPKKVKTRVTQEIRNLIKENQEEFQETRVKIEEMFMQLQQHCDENNRKILSLVNSLDNSTDDNEINQKENLYESKRRSLRLQHKSPITSTPVLLIAGDLRKSTLKKNLVLKHPIYGMDSPRVKNAMTLYNNTRNACSALLTPKTLRTQMTDSPTGWRANLSRKVEQQCLLLQDTPQHKPI